MRTFYAGERRKTTHSGRTIKGEIRYDVVMPLTDYDWFCWILISGFLGYGVFALIRNVKGRIEGRKRTESWQRMGDGQAPGFEVLPPEQKP